MKLKFIMNRFIAPEADGIDVPINFTTTFDASGMTQMQGALSKVESSFKKMQSGTSGVASSMKNRMKLMTAPSAATYNASMAGLKASIGVQANQFKSKLDAGKKPRGTVSSMFSKQEKNERTTAGSNAYWDSLYSTIEKTNPLIEALGQNLQQSLGATTINNTKSLAESMAEVNKSSSNTNSSLSKIKDSSENAGNGLKKLASVIRASVLVQIQALYHVLRRAFSFLEHSFKAAGDYVESINLYTMSVGEYAEEGKKWATQISDALYLDTSEIYQYTGQFYNLTRGLGASAKAADLMSRNLTQLTYDMASYLNIDVEVANNKLMSAMSGQTKAVTSVGIAVQSASLQELAYSLNINKAVESMTQAEKTYLRYIQIMRSTTQMQGDLGRTIITPTNAMRLLRTQLNLLSRAIGQVFTPIIMKTIPYIIAFTQVLTELAQSLAKMFGYKLEDYLAPASSVKSLADNFGDLDDAAKGAADSINRTLAPFDELNVVEMQGKGGGAGGLGADSVLSDLEQYLDGYDMLEFYTEGMKDKIESIKKKIKELGPIIAAAFGAAVLIKFLKKLNSVWATLKGLFKTTSGAPTLLGSIIGKVKQLGNKEVTLLGVTSKLSTKFLGGAGLVVSLITATKSMANLGSKTGDATKNMIGFGASIAGATASGFALGGPLGALVGGLSALTVGILGYAAGYEKLQWQIAKENVFGTLRVSTEKFKEMLDKTGPSIGETSTKIQELNESIKQNGDAFNENLDTVSTYLWRFGTFGQTLNDEYSTEILNAFNSLFENANQIISDGTERSVEIWTTALQRTTVLTGEEQAEILQMITSNGEFQKQEIDSAQTRINEIWATASKERRSLTQEEIDEIEDLLHKMDEVTRKQVSETEVELYTMRQEFSDKNFQLDEKSYENYKKALDKYQKEKTKEINKQYLQELADADYQADLLYKRLLKQGVSEEEATKQKNEKLSTLRNLANENQEKQMKEMDEFIKSSNEELLSTLKTKYQGLINDTSEGARKQRAIIEGVFKQFTNDPFGELRGQCKDAFGGIGDQSAKAFLENAQKRFSRSEFDFSVKINNAKGFAAGGFPDTGEMFIARESGPELVGKIGSKTAVANNDQITSALTNALTVALDGTNNNKQPIHNTVYIGNRKVFDGMNDYIDSENDRYGTNYVRV